jgi:hypothetical protein
MAITPNFTKTPRTERGLLSVANTNRDGTGTTVSLFIAHPTLGSRVERITITATDTTTNGMIRFYIFDGINTDLKLEITVSAITPSSTVKAFTFEVINLGWIIAAGKSIKASTHNSENFRIIVEGGDFDV